MFKMLSEWFSRCLSSVRSWLFGLVPDKKPGESRETADESRKIPPGLSLLITRIPMMWRGRSREWEKLVQIRVTLERDGATRWDALLEGNPDVRIDDALVDKSEKLLLAGSFSGVLIIGARTFENQGPRSLFAACFDLDGNLRWLRRYEAPQGVEVVCRLTFDPKKGILLNAFSRDRGTEKESLLYATIVEGGDTVEHPDQIGRVRR